MSTFITQAVDRIIAEIMSKMTRECPEATRSFIGHRYYAVYHPTHQPTGGSRGGTASADQLLPVRVNTPRLAGLAPQKRLK